MEIHNDRTEEAMEIVAPAAQRGHWDSGHGGWVSFQCLGLKRKHECQQLCYPGLGIRTEVRLGGPARTIL